MSFIGKESLKMSEHKNQRKNQTFLFKNNNWYIRYATVDDIDNIRLLLEKITLSLRNYVPESYVTGESNFYRSKIANTIIKEQLFTPKRIFLIACTTQEDIIGLIRGQKEQTVCKLSYLGVAPNYRKQGIGKSLLHFFLEEAKRINSTKVYLYTVPKLTVAIQLYKNSGFLQEGYLKKHFFGEDMLILSKFL